MYNTFEFVGKIFPIKETDKFKPYEEVVYDSGWMKKTLKFNVVCGSNRHMLTVDSLTNKDENKTVIYTTGKAAVGEDGARKKGENLQIKFANRFDQSEIEKVAEFRKFVVDTEKPKHRANLEKALEKFKDNTMTTEQMEVIGCQSIEECGKALASSKAKRHEFISSYDFLEYLNKLVRSEKIKDKLFRIVGNYEVTYGEKTGKFYTNLIPNRIYMAADDAEPVSQVSLGVFFNSEAVKSNEPDDNGKYHVDANIMTYNSSYKKNIASPISITIDSTGDEKAEKRAKGFKKKFAFPDTDATWRELGIIANFLDGAQKTEITEDMLTEEQKENIEYGLITMDDIRKEIGKDVYGDRVRDIVITGLARGFTSGAQDTAYTDKDFVLPIKDSSSEEGFEDLFNEEDDLDI